MKLFFSTVIIAIIVFSVSPSYSGNPWNWKGKGNAVEFSARLQSLFEEVGVFELTSKKGVILQSQHRIEAIGDNSSVVIISSKYSNYFKGVIIRNRCKIDLSKIGFYTPLDTNADGVARYGEDFESASQKLYYEYNLPLPMVRFFNFELSYIVKGKSDDKYDKSYIDYGYYNIFDISGKIPCKMDFFLINPVTGEVRITKEIPKEIGIPKYVGVKFITDMMSRFFIQTNNKSVYLSYKKILKDTLELNKQRNKNTQRRQMRKIPW